MTAAYKQSTDVNPYALHATLLPTPADHRDWLLQRREGVGASECAAILGMSTYQGDTVFDVWLDKTGKVPLSDADTESAEWGRILEPVIRDRAAERLGYRVFTVGGLQSRRHPWQRASLDAVLDVPGDGPIPLEIKNTSQYLAADWADDQVPDRAELQVQHQLSVTGAPYAYVAGLIGGNRLVIRRVDRDLELIDHITAEEAVFWQHVQAGTEPPITARENLSSLIGAAGRSDTDVMVADPATEQTVREWVTTYRQATADEKQAAAKKAEARNNLIWLAQGHREVTAMAGDVQHTLFKVQAGVFAAKKFETDHPDEAALYMRKVEVIDSKAVKAEEPTLYRQYQSVSIRLPKDGA